MADIRDIAYFSRLPTGFAPNELQYVLESTFSRLPSGDSPILDIVVHGQAAAFVMYREGHYVADSINLFHGKALRNHTISVKTVSMDLADLLVQLDSRYTSHLRDDYHDTQNVDRHMGSPLGDAPAATVPTASCGLGTAKSQLFELIQTLNEEEKQQLRVLLAPSVPSQPQQQVVSPPRPKLFKPQTLSFTPHPQLGNQQPSFHPIITSSGASHRMQFQGPSPPASLHHPPVPGSHGAAFPVGMGGGIPTPDPKPINGGHYGFLSQGMV